MEESIIRERFTRDKLAFNALIDEDKQSGGRRGVSWDKNVVKECNRYQQLIPLFDSLVHVSPSHPYKAKCLYFKGRLFKKMKYFHNAIAAFEEALQMDDTLKEAWCHCGTSFEKTRNYESAIYRQNMALSIDPNYSLALFHKVTAGFYSTLTDKEAMEIFDQLLKIRDAFPDSPPNVKKVSFFFLSALLSF